MDIHETPRNMHLLSIREKTEYPLDTPESLRNIPLSTQPAPFFFFFPQIFQQYPYVSEGLYAQLCLLKLHAIEKLLRPYPFLHGKNSQIQMLIGTFEILFLLKTGP